VFAALRTFRAVDDVGIQGEFRTSVPESACRNEREDNSSPRGSVLPMACATVAVLQPWR